MSLLRVSLALAACIALASACRTASGQRTLPDGSPESRASEVVVEDATPEQRANVTAAVRAVAAVWGDPRFWALAREQRFLDGPDGTVVTGDALAARLQAIDPARQRYRVAGRLWSAWYRLWFGTTAMTAVCGEIRLASHTVDNPVPLLANTVAHELTHLVGEGTDGPLGCDTPSPRYWDKGNSAATIPWLASYAFGDLAQCFHQSGGEREATLACFETTVNGDDGRRSHDRCCLETKDPAVETLRRDVCAEACR